jgi:hypothetical protein
LAPAEVAPRTLLKVTGNVRADLLFRRNAPAYRSRATPSAPTDSPCEPWPLLQHRNSRVCRSDAERVQMAWRRLVLVTLAPTTAPGSALGGPPSARRATRRT